MQPTPLRSDSTSSPLQAVEPAFRCQLDRDCPGAAWVCVAGELDLVTAPRLAEMLREATQRARLVVVDLRALTRVDVSGVLTLVSASRSARHDGQRLVLVRGLSKVDRLLALTGASHDVEIIDLAAGEPAVQALLHIERQDRPATRIRARALRRVAPLLGTGPIFRGMDAMIARGARSDFIDG